MAETPRISMKVRGASVVSVPIDDSLTHEGQAADAKAVGDALAGKADRSDVKTSVNYQEADAQGLILLKAEHIPTGDDPTDPNVGELLETLSGRTGADIPLTDAEGSETIAQAIQGMAGRTADTLPMSDEDETTVAEKLEEMETEIGSAVKTVTAGGSVHTPDSNGNVTIDEVENARQLVSSKNQETTGAFIVRPASGAGSISDGDATAERIRGMMNKTGYVPEVMTWYATPVPRPTPEGITAEIDNAAFIAAVEEAGTYVCSYSLTGWDNPPAAWGITVTGTPAAGDTITVTWDGENTPVMTVSSPRQPAEEITAVLNETAFKTAVGGSAEIRLIYTNAWSADPASYGWTVTGEPVAGDQLYVRYVAEERGTIVTATPTRLVSTGWNLYNPATGRCRCTRYSEQYGYKIGGSWTRLEYSQSVNGARTEITPNANGIFNVAGDGWLHVTGGNDTTYVYTTWSDWIVSYAGELAAYTEDGIDLTDVMSHFPYGLCRVGSVADVIDLTRQECIRNIERVAYSDAARASAAASGRAWDFDTNYIYLEREEPLSWSFTKGVKYAMNEHGLEYFEGTTVGPELTALYGTNLKDKLERNVAALDMTLAELMGRG